MGHVRRKHTRCVGSGRYQGCGSMPTRYNGQKLDMTRRSTQPGRLGLCSKNKDPSNRKRNTCHLHTLTAGLGFILDFYKRLLLQEKPIRLLSNPRALWVLTGLQYHSLNDEPSFYSRTKELVTPLWFLAHAITAL